MSGFSDATATDIMPIINGNGDIVDALRTLYCQVLALPVEEVDINLSFISLGGKKIAYLA